MTQITMKIDDMHCGMCESRVNDIIRRAANVKKVTSSHAKGKMVILFENEFDEEAVKSALTAEGYFVLSVDKEPYKKRGFLGIFGK